MKISIIGTGYVGLVTGVCLAELGHQVLCMDIDPMKIERLSKAESTIYEPGLEQMLAANLGERLAFTNELAQAVEFAGVILIATGTPAGKNDEADISSVEKTCESIVNLMNEDKILVIKSTVPVGTCRQMKERMQKLLSKSGQWKTRVVSNPEFLRQGSAIEDFMKPDRIVVGVEAGEAAELRELYGVLLERGAPWILTNLETSELIKYASNAFLATKISYINELAILSEKFGAGAGSNVDMKVVAQAMGLDQRIGDKFLKPGPGYGGSCFPKDTKALLQIGKKAGYEPAIVKAAVEVNRRQIKYLYKKIERLLSKLEGKTITLLGLSFKPETDDLREAPAIALIEELMKYKLVIRAYDPKAMEGFRRMFAGRKEKAELVCCDTAMEACAGSDCIVVMTEWQEFFELDLAAVARVTAGHILIDARNIYDSETVRREGFVYEGIGTV